MYKQSLLERWAAPLTGKTVEVQTLEERLLSINDLPGMSARALLSPGTEYGTTVVQVETKEKPVDGQLSINNYGRKEIGGYRTDASVNFNNPFGIGDQFGIRGSYSERSLLKMLGVNYSLPLNIQGTRLSANYTAVNYDIGGDLGDLGINGKSELGGINVIPPFIRKQNQNLFGTAGVRYFNGRQFVSDTQITESNVKIVETGVAWNRVSDNFDVTSAAMRVSSNFRSKIDNEYSSRQRYKLELDATHLWRIHKQWDLKFAASGQLASTMLADSEKFSLGGPNSVRGYPAADVRGDRGGFGSIETRYHPTFIKVPSYFNVFIDSGYVSRVNPSPGTPTSETISSVGFGFSFLPVRSVTIEVAAAKPLSHPNPSGNRDNGRIWLNVTTSF